MAVDRFAAQRAEMVKLQIEQRGVTDPRLLEAMRTVPRHEFIPDDQRDMAYDDCPLAIGSGQTISQPYIVALMTQLLHLRGEETVLEIGTGSGYQAAVLSRLAHYVHTVERFAPLASRAQRVLNTLYFKNVSVHTGDGSLGWPDAAPYQAILVTAAAPAPPPPLLDQLADGGRLVLPVGGRGGQTLQVWQRDKDTYDHEDIIYVAFVPLRGAHGWNEIHWD
jgi:protein-L-isoaspartate(D-aspartate) O-methyltransferase